MAESMMDWAGGGAQNVTHLNSHARITVELVKGSFSYLVAKKTGQV